MVKSIILIAIFLVFYSCATQKNEYLEFKTSNAMIIGSETSIKLIPTYRSNPKNVKVEIFSRSKYFSCSKITTEKYSEILNLFSQLSEKDSAKIIQIDPPSFEINFKKGDSIRKMYYLGMPQKNEKWYDLTHLILGTAKLKMEDLD